MDRDKRYAFTCDLQDYIDIVSIILLERKTDTITVLYLEDDESPRTNEHPQEHRIEPSCRAAAHEIVRGCDAIAQLDERGKTFFKRHTRREGRPLRSDTERKPKDRRTRAYANVDEDPTRIR